MNSADEVKNALTRLFAAIDLNSRRPLDKIAVYTAVVSRLDERERQTLEQARALMENRLIEEPAGFARRAAVLAAKLEGIGDELQAELEALRETK
ncbi:hypothetical protein N0M98_16360 [Paenibacillus doosanensis]|uniref:Uncharacterized protein n=1 Tax=Paenibacillus konkukensis TaxID=2020716 RepID=A0ABY4RNH0_9BACL|nr:MULTISPECIES: hypothetical protein [Paenibacillus]MCS7461728.1 hypothetical protein [Paenibacillus doosanensis]UQZ83570.1 hypothetical protein SK3146_02757 [Paenibacillus konkukensis]